LSSNNIYINWEAAQEAIDIIRDKKIVFTNGCFDILHPGHHQTLDRSKELGDILILGLNSDDSVSRLKGNDRPIHDWDDRAQALLALSSVDIVIGFEEDTPLELITSLRPHTITKGGDYTIEEMIGADVVIGYGGEVIILPFLEGHSTTEIISRTKQ